MPTRWLAKPAKKIFVIGRNKTGTTSVAKALADGGYRVGDQRQAEWLMDDWIARDFRRIARYCRTADAFQDVPFSLAYTYQAMDQAFPGQAKFILTVRDNAEQWYESLVRYHSRLLQLPYCPPRVADLQAFPYVYPGWLWRQQEIVYGATESSVYDRELYMQHYREHNRAIMTYFRHRPRDLLVLNLAEESASERLCRFLDLPTGAIEIPHLNRSS